MQIAIDAAKFTADEANGLRRAMATFRKMGTISTYETKLVKGMTSRGYSEDFARRCFEQIKGFGDYGFPESHAASFALLVYVSSWLKCHHPEVFAAALLNSQPMGFYAPAQIVRDAREHGVEVRAPDINHSGWDCTLEPADAGGFALRLGLRTIDGMREADAVAIVEARGRGYDDPATLRRRAGLGRGVMERLAAADAFRSLDLDRRQALWAVRGGARDSGLPLFDAAETSAFGRETAAALPVMPLSEHVLQDYQTTGLSLKAHPVSFLRETYGAMGLVTTRQANARRSGSWVKTGGVVLVRQRPGTASGVVFVTLEDETGIANLVVWQRVFERYRPVVMGARILAVRGRVQSADNVVHIVAEELIDRTDDLSLLSEDAQRQALDRGMAPTDEVARPVSREVRGRHPRNVRVIPQSRDFH